MPEVLLRTYHTGFPILPGTPAGLLTTPGALSEQDSQDHCALKAVPSRAGQHGSVHAGNSGEETLPRQRAERRKHAWAAEPWAALLRLHTPALWPCHEDVLGGKGCLELREGLGASSSAVGFFI